MRMETSGDDVRSVVKDKGKKGGEVRELEGTAKTGVCTLQGEGCWKTQCVSSRKGVGLGKRTGHLELAGGWEISDGMVQVGTPLQFLGRRQGCRIVSRRHRVQRKLVHCQTC